MGQEGQVPITKISILPNYLAGEKAVFKKWIKKRFSGKLNTGEGRKMDGSEYVSSSDYGPKRGGKASGRSSGESPDAVAKAPSSVVS